MCQACFKCFPRVDSVLTPSLWHRSPPPPRCADVGTDAKTQGTLPRAAAQQTGLHRTLRLQSPGSRSPQDTGPSTPASQCVERGVSRSDHRLCIRNSQEWQQ